MKRLLYAIGAALTLILATAGFGTCHGDPGALVKASVTGVTVGVLLDDIPAGTAREAVATQILAQPDTFWTERAKFQARVGHEYRGIFLKYFYVDTGGSGSAALPKGQLPWPPESTWTVTWSRPATRGTLDGHDYVYRTYDLSGTLLVTKDSPAGSVLALGSVGGTYSEPENWPYDPTLVIQHTGNACVDELEYPAGSYDVYHPEKFFDVTCMADGSTPWCHIDEATEDCLPALDATVGQAPVDVTFTRLKWKQKTADQVRVTVPTTMQPDLVTDASLLEDNYTRYRYFEPDDCTVIEGNVDAPGWARVLEFSAQSSNVGVSDIYLGETQQIVDDGRNLFEYAPCHGHYHMHGYAEHFFTFDDGSIFSQKEGFAVEGVELTGNNEATPLNHLHDNAGFQGIPPGWGDLYQAGIPGQWIDVTSVDTSAGEVTGTLTSTVNPVPLLCEGHQTVDAAGVITAWEPSGQYTDDGLEIQRPVCTYDYVPDTAANNSATVPVSIPADGEGSITRACSAGEVGPLRDCGWAYEGVYTCTPGTEVSHSVSMSATLPTVRICEEAGLLATGTACLYLDAVAQATDTTVTFTCPEIRDVLGTGGYSVYVGDTADL